MKSTTFVLGAFLASVAIAQPHRPHHARHHKRADAETTVVVTDWVYEYETVGVTTTIWVSPGFVEPEVTSSTSTSTTSTPKTTSSSAPAAQFFEPAKTFSTQAPAPTTTSTSSTSVSSSPSPVYVAPTTSTAPSVYVAPVESSSSSYVAPPVVVPTTTAPPAVVYTAPAETTTSAAAPAATTSNSGSSSYGGVCSSGSPCSGDITYYEAGLGACGLTNDGSTERVVALPHGLMGTQSNGNPYCGKTITIEHGGKKTTATVVDKCMGCEGDSIDLSNAAFQELADFAVGRTTATWYFN